MRADTRSDGAAGRATGTGRRRPVQQRSQERYERMLDACAGLLDEVTPAALTTKEVAARAGVPIGTLYQFFGGKEDLLAALAGRNLEQYVRRLDHRLSTERPTLLAGFTDLAVEEFVAMKRTVPGFRQMDFGLVGAPGPADPRTGAGEPPLDERHLLDGELDNNTAVALRLRSLGGELFAAQDPAALTLGLRVALESADAVLKLAFRTDPDGDPALIAECKRLVRCYLADRLGEAR
ncbi:TetR family transcriptional regulator [Kitasatospora sp. NPDC004240]